MKNTYLTSLLLLCLLPYPALAAGSLQNLMKNTIIVISDTVIPFLFGIAFLMFVINVIRYFVIEGSNEQGRDKAKDLAVYSVAAFTFLILFWGIINLLVDSIGLKDQTQPCPDFIMKSDPKACP